MNQRKIKYSLLIMIFLTLISAIFSVQENENNQNFRYLYFQLDENAQTNKLAYAIEFDKEEGYNFKMQIYLDGVLQEKTCEKDLITNTDMDFRKVICEVPKYGDGNYLFNATITDSNNNIISNLKNRENLFQEIKSNLIFDEKDGKTTITINVEGQGENIRIEHEIPKEVIEYLDEKNKDTLIHSDLEYEIVDSDPLIAWNVDKTPTQINYTIDKTITKKDRENFNVDITNQPSFNILKIIVFFMIFAILGFLLIPVFKKKKSKK